jgi:hypothetical protein
LHQPGGWKICQIFLPVGHIATVLISVTVLVMALLLSCQQRGKVVGNMPDLHEAAGEASNGGVARGSSGGVAGMLERLMSSLTLRDAGAGGVAGDGAADGVGLQDFSGLVAEAGAGMVRYE